MIASAEPDRQFFVRRAIDDRELAFYRCYNPNHAGFSDLVRVAGARWPIEECFAASKNETGIDNYQVRTWKAWRRHIAFSMLAHTFLAVTAHRARKSGDPRASSRVGRSPGPGTAPTDPTHPC